MTKHEKINHKDYIDIINKIFKNKDIISSFELKQELEQFNNNKKLGTLFGSLLSSLMANKIIEKVDSKYELKNGKKIYYYKIMNQTDTCISNNEYIIFDQYNIQYIPNTVNIKKYIYELLLDNPKLTLTLFKKTDSYKANIEILQI